MDDALVISSVSAKSGNTKAAKSAISIANAMMDDLRSAKVPADPKFFLESVNKFRNLRTSPQITVKDEAFNGMLRLAEYRSALTTVPAGFHPRYEYKGGPKGV